MAKQTNSNTQRNTKAAKVAVIAPVDSAAPVATVAAPNRHAAKVFGKAGILAEALAADKLNGEMLVKVAAGHTIDQRGNYGKIRQACAELVTANKGKPVTLQAVFLAAFDKLGSTRPYYTDTATKAAWAAHFYMRDCTKARINCLTAA